MKTIIASPSAGVLSIGRQGENLARRVRFELPPDWDMSDPTASVQLAVQRAGEDTAYPVILSREDGAYYWDVTATDTACRGYNQCELRYMRGEVIAKSMTWATYVSEAIDADLTDPPEGSENYLSRVMAEGAKAVDAAGRAEQSAAQADDALKQLQPAIEQALGDIRTEGDTQVQRVSDEGAQQIKEATRQAGLAAEAAGNAEGSAKRAEAAAIRQPYPDESTGTWWCWDTEAGAYVDSGLKAVPDALRIASPDVLGGVQPVARTDDMTIPVGVDEVGRLHAGKDPEVNQLRSDLSDLAPAGAVVGQLFRVAAISEDGKYTMEPVDMPIVPVKDVTVAGASVVKDGVADVPMSSHSIAGAVKYVPTYGVACLKDWAGYSAYAGVPSIVRATEENIIGRTERYKPIVPSTIDFAVKAAMCDGKGAPWTAEEQAAARERMGVPGDYELIAEITTTEDLDSVVINTDADGNDLRLSNAYIHLEMAIGSGDGQARLYVRDENKIGIANPYIGNISGTAKRFTMYEIYKQNGLFHCCYCSATSSRANGTLGYDVEKSGRFKKYIASIRFDIINTVKIPAGSKISFYGIRSDA